MAILNKISWIMLFSAFGFAFASDLSMLDSAYTHGDIDYLREHLPNTKGETKAEKERIEYYQAICQSSPNFLEKLQEIAKQENNQYSQEASIEISKTYYLNKKFSQAVEILQKVNKPTLQAEKFYWLAYCQFALAGYQDAIYYAQDFLDLSQNNDKIENIYILISNCYIHLDQHKLALKLLQSANQRRLLSSQKAAALYNIALCYKSLDDQKEMNKTIFLLKKDFPYSKYSQLLSQPTNNNQEYTANSNFQPGTYLQVGAFHDNKNALETEQALKNSDFNVTIKKELINQTLLYKVWVGPFSSGEEINKTKQKLLSQNYPSFAVHPEQEKSITLVEKKYFLECGVFTDPAKLRQRLQRLKDLGIVATAYSRKVGDNSFMYGVIGPFPDKETAIAQQQELKEQDISSNLFIK